MFTELDLAHPSTEEAHLDEVGRRLREELDRMIAQLRSLEPEVAQILDDAGVIQEDRDSARMLLEYARQNVESARSAVDRFESGSYGLCARCARPIGAERLEAIPDTQMCVTCQAQH